MQAATATVFELNSIAKLGNMASQMRKLHIPQNAASHMLLKKGIEGALTPSLCGVQGATNSSTTFIEYVGVDHGGRNIGVAE
jgi:hypothetical protein